MPKETCPDLKLQSDEPITTPEDDSLEDSANLPDPSILAAEITEDLQSALEELQAISDDLAAAPGRGTCDDVD